MRRRPVPRDLRDVINKGLTEEVILKGASDAFHGGWNRVKLYFMLGLPTETEEDMEGIALLSEKVAETYYDEIPKAAEKWTCSGSCQLLLLCSEAIYPIPVGDHVHQGRIFKNEPYLVKDKFRQMLNYKSLKYNYHEADLTVLEGVLARGDRRVAAVVEEVYKNGAIFDSWGENFDNDTVDESI